MAVFPLLERDLNIALRKQRPVSRRMKVAGGGIAGTLVLLILVNFVGDDRASEELHLILFLVGIGFALQAPKLVAGVIARERQEQTLGLLFLSGLGAGEIFLGKFLSSALIAFADLLAIYPMMAIPFLTGGISFDHFFATVCWLPNFLLFLLSISLLASVLSEDGMSALPLATALGAIFCLLPPVIYFAGQQISGASVAHFWLVLSPIYGAAAIFKRNSRISLDFWQSFGLVFGYSLSCLSLAAWRLSRVWRVVAFGAPNSRWNRLWQSFYYRSLALRKQLNRRWLEVNPIVVLEFRDHKPTILAWTVVSAFVVLWTAGFAFWSSRSNNIPFIMISVIVMCALLRWIIFHTGASAMARGRLDGAYDLLLTTPLAPAEIVWGHVEALKLQFRTVARVVLGIEVLLAVGGLLARSWRSPALVLYFVTWAILIFWTWKQTSTTRHAIPSMWSGFNSLRPAHAAWKTLGINLWGGIWFIGCFRPGWAALARFPTGSLAEYIGTISIGLLLFVMVLRPSADVDQLEARLVTEFREIVQEPIPEPGDPRFKRWDPLDRFPWGGEIANQQRLERLQRKHKNPRQKAD